MVVVVFQPWTGWWFSRNDIVCIYIIKISLSWQQSSGLYLNLPVRFKYVMQHFICYFHTPYLFPSPPPHFPPQYSHSPQWKSAYFFILNQDKLFLVIALMIFLQYKMIFCINPHYTFDLSNYFSLKLLWQGGVQENGGTATMTLVHVWVLFYLFHPKHMHQGK